MGTRHHTPSDLPLRFEIRTLTDEELAARNVDRATLRQLPFPPAEEVIAEIATTPRITGRRAHTWFYHPDERVQLALLQNEALTPRESRRGGRNFRALAIWGTAVATAEAERVAWTPVLDRLVMRNLWPNHADGAVLTQSEEYVEQVPDAGLVRWRPVIDQAARLHRWIRSGEPEKIEQLLRYEADAFVGHVLRGLHTTRLDLFRRTLEQRPALGPTIADGKELAVEVRQELKAWAFADMHVTPGRLTALPANTPTWKRDQCAYGARTLQRIAMATAGDGVTWMRRMARALTDEEIDRLLAMLDGTDDRSAGPASGAAHVLLAALGRLRPDALIQLAERLPRNASSLTLIARCEQATPRVWLTCLERGGEGRLRQAIARRDAAVRDPDVRKALVRSNAPFVLERLLRTAQGADTRAAFRKLARRDPAIAGKVLGDRPHIAEHLTRDDLAPLLQSEAQATRLVAITALPNTKPTRQEKARRR